MTTESTLRILESYQRIAPTVDDMVAGFYDRVFAAAPEVRPLFQRDMTVQRQHLAATLALLVRNLPFQDLLDEPVMDLGAQHVIWGVRPEYYPVVRDALLGSIGQSLGQHWTEQLQADWKSLLDHVITTMLKGATRYVLQATATAMAKPENPR